MLIASDNKYFWRGSQISEARYHKIMGIIRSRPEAPQGQFYRLTDALEWELHDLPQEPAADEVTDEELGRMVREGLA